MSNCTIISEIIGSYKGYEITKHTSIVGDIIYNATYYLRNNKSVYSVSCSSDNLEELKKQVDEQLQIKFHYKKLEYTIKAKSGKKR